MIKESKMPELKAGMLVELYSKDDGRNIGRFVYVNDDLLYAPNGKHGTTLSGGLWGIAKLYKQCCHVALHSSEMNLESRLLWSKNSYNKKLEELEQTIAEASEQIREIKRSL